MTTSRKRQWQRLSDLSCRRRRRSALAFASIEENQRRAFPSATGTATNQTETPQSTQFILTTTCATFSTASRRYGLRRRSHSFQLPGHPTRLSDCNFLTRMLYQTVISFCIFLYIVYFCTLNINLRLVMHLIQ